MKPKMIVKLCVDIGMTFILLLLMTYELVGQTAHEWLGIGMFVLFVVHHILNGRWRKRLLKGKYTPLRVWQTTLVLLIFVSMISSMISGVILSRHALAFLPISGGRSFGRSLHMLAAYWGFALMSLHLGFHWNMMMRIAGKMRKNSSLVCTWTLRILAIAIAAYGVYAFVKRDIGNYMLLRIQFVFFDFDEPFALFLLDYIAVMGVFVWIGHYLTEILNWSSRKKNSVSVR